MPEAAPSPGVAQWHAQRGQLTALAYRMLGQWAQAEDVVSAVGEQILSMDPATATGVRRWEGYLRALTTRRAIDALRSVQQQRTEYVGTWLPEPVDQALLPEDAVANESMLRLGVLFLLEELSAPARAAYVLHHGLGYSSSQIANVLAVKPAAVRQMLSRAARKLGRAQAPQREEAEVKGLLARIVQAIERADVPELVALLDAQVVLHSDGGGQVRAALNPVSGADRVARFLIGVQRKNPVGNVSLGQVNGAPALLMEREGRTDLLTVDMAAGAATRILLIANPQKLGHLGAAFGPLPG